MPNARNRDYSATPNVHNIAINYAWNPASEVQGAEGINTGAWSALQAGPNGLVVSIGSGSSVVLENRSGVLGGTGFFSGLLFAANPYRQEFFVQSISTVIPSYIRFGAQASSQAFSVLLNAAGTSGQGGGSLSNEKFKGAVYFSGGAVNGYEI